MHEASQQVVNAVTAIKALEAVYGKFVADSKVPSATWQPELGSVSVTSSGVTCYSLGRKVTATPRPVAVVGQVKALEFDFVTAWQDRDWSLLHLYLQSDGRWTRDLDGEQLFGAHDDLRVKDHLVQALCAALLLSPLFLPSSPAAAMDERRVVNLAGAAVARHVQAVR